MDDLEFNLLNKEFQIGIFRAVADEEGSLLYINKILMEKLNYNVSSEFLYKKIIDLYFNPSEWLNQIECVKREETCLFKNVALKTSNGKPFYLDIYLSYASSYVYGIARDSKNTQYKENVNEQTDNSDTIVIDLDKPQKLNLRSTRKAPEKISENFEMTNEEKLALLNIQNSPNAKQGGTDYIETDSKDHLESSVFDNQTFDDAPFGMIIQRENVKKAFFNKKLKEIFKIKEDAIGYYGLFINYILPSIETCGDGVKNKDGCLKKIIDTLNTQETFLFKIRLTNNKIFEYRIYPIIINLNNQSTLYGRVFYFFETTKENEEIDYLKTLSFQDELTGINNRRSFDNIFEKSIEHAKRYKKSLSLIMFDIDNFKQVNDNYGHQKGDDVLKELAFLVQAGIRKSDIFARYGGEEFMILCTETTLPQAMYLAEKIRALIQNNKFSIHTTITCSFGVTQYQEPESKKDFITRVDKLLYKAKQNGKNRVEIG